MCVGYLLTLFNVLICYIFVDWLLVLFLLLSLPPLPFFFFYSFCFLLLIPLLLLPHSLVVLWFFFFLHNTIPNTTYIIASDLHQVGKWASYCHVTEKKATVRAA